jgi:hypothetical protein
VPAQLVDHLAEVGYRVEMDALQGFGIDAEKVTPDFILRHYLFGFLVVPLVGDKELLSQR